MAGLITSFVVLFCVALCYHATAFPQHGQSSSISLNAETRQIEFANGNYIVDWSVDAETIFFNLSVVTTGYVGFGISPSTASMAGADIVIAGVKDDGTPYFGDYYAVQNGRPTMDPSQDWELIDAKEAEGKTVLQYSRPLDTCDDQDVPITDNTLYFIWSFGVNDNIEHHGNTNRGGVAVNMLDPPMPAPDVTGFEIWELKRDVKLPENQTVYWCTMHKREPLIGKRHVVGFSPKLETPEAVKHTHHFILYSCRAPTGQDPDDVFGPYVGLEGGDCYAKPEIMPTELCSTALYVWAVGGEPLFFPEHVGYPINEDGVNDQYLMFEIHYDNPEQLKDVTFEAGVNIYYTEANREHEAEMLQISHFVAESHIIPPQSEAFTTVGHCSGDCTKSKLPETGINIFNVMLHSHLAGRRLKLRHFRDGEELPWVAYDDHYVFDYQQNRPLREEVLVLPGDHLSYECVTNTVGINTVTLGGLSTRHEMCQSFSWYYPRQNLAMCNSVYPYMDRIFDIFGIQNLTSGPDSFDPIVTAPPEHAGKLYSQVLSEYDWAGHPQLPGILQQELRFSKHAGQCLGFQDAAEQTHKVSSLKLNILDEYEIEANITYPEIQKPYAPPQTCDLEVDPSTTTLEPATSTIEPETSTDSSTPNSGTMTMLRAQTIAALTIVFMLFHV